METTVKVCESSMELIAILRQFNIAYEMFQTYIEKHYGGAKGPHEKAENEFYDRWCDVTSVVEKFLCDSMLYELRETKFTSI